MEKRKLRFIGHVLRHNEFIGKIFEGKILGKKTRGRPRQLFLDVVKVKMGLGSYALLKRAAQNRKE